MFRQAVAACLIVSASAASSKDAPKLEFSQDGKDLVVKTKLIVNACSHVLWTDVLAYGGKVTLRYHVIQCPDQYVRSLKDIEITWRVPNGKQEGMKFDVMDDFRPNTAQLKALLPQLEKLAAEGDRLYKRAVEEKKD